MLIPAESPYGAPVHMVAKKQPGEYRITGDFRLLNKQTEADKYSTPLVTDFIGQLSGCQIFSSIDFFKSCHQIEIAAEDVHKTAIITPVGNYTYKRLPMRLGSAGSTFQRFMHEILRGIPNCFTYIDDILIFSENREEHFKTSFTSLQQTRSLRPHFKQREVHL